MNYSSNNLPRRRLVILGATGSIGQNAVAVAAAHPELFEVVAVTCASQGTLLNELAAKCHAKYQYCAAAPTDPALPNEAAVCDLIASDQVDVVLCAIQGISALRQVMAALGSGKVVCLATKEVLVAAGAWVNEIAQKNGGTILPVDSEHCAIFQCLHNEEIRTVRRLILTCSGGPFHFHPEIDLATVTPAQAMKHPTWNMGAKITLDSATLMNKAFEVIEAAWLYGVSEDKIQVVIHPQALIHSMVEFQDGAVLAQLGPTDMKLPIQYCLTYPQRMPAMMAPMDFTHEWHLDMLPPDTKRFPALDLARRTLQMGGLAGAVFNAANDAACRRFLDGNLTFNAIPLAVEAALDRTPNGTADSFEALDAAAKAAYDAVNNFRSA